MLSRGLPRVAFFDIDENQTLVIGRGEQSDTRINDPSVSRVHCEVTVCEEQITIVDKGSSSGTFVSGRAIEKLDVDKGCVVKIGDTEFHVGDPNEDAITKVVPTVGGVTYFRPVVASVSWFPVGSLHARRNYRIG